MTYSPGHDFAIAVTRFFAASRVCAASTKRGLPSPRNLRMQKGRANQTPSGGQFLQGAVARLSHESGVLGAGYATLAFRFGEWNNFRHDYWRTPPRTRNETLETAESIHVLWEPASCQLK